MSKKPVSREFDVCRVVVDFDSTKDYVHVSKSYNLADEVMHSESHFFPLATMPLQVALQMACAVVSNVGLLDFVDDAK